MPGTHRAAVRSPRRWLITAVVVGLVAALVGPVGANGDSGDGFQFEVSSGGQFAFDNGRQDDADSSMSALIKIYLDGNVEVSGEVVNGDPGDYTFAIGIRGQCAGNVELFDFTIPEDGEPGTTPISFTGPVTLASGYDFVRIYSADNPANICLTVWGNAIPTDPMAMITSPDADSINMGTVDLAVTYYDNDYDPVLWAVRDGTCAASTDTVAGNVDGFDTPFMWNGKAFSSSVDLAAGYYCFVFNTQAQSGDDGVRETRWFYVADAEVAGGGQILADSGDRKDPYKISFGGELYRVGPSEYLCDWTVQLHNVSIDELDGAKFKATTCTEEDPFENFIPPENPDADGVVNFIAEGTLDGVPTDAIFRMEDFGEPGSADTLRITFEQDGSPVYDTSDMFGPGGDFPSESNNEGTARTFLDKGNIQITFAS